MRLAEFAAYVVFAVASIAITRHHGYSPAVAIAFAAFATAGLIMAVHCAIVIYEIGWRLIYIAYLRCKVWRQQREAA
jgi:hypothetical protein